MDIPVAAAFIAPVVRPTDRSWADLGAGDGTFTIALASLLPANATIHALDRDPARLSRLRATVLAEHLRQRIVVTAADLTRLDGAALPDLDGALLANVLHFMAPADQQRLLDDVAGHLAPGGRIVVVEYEARTPSRWVPYPLSSGRLTELAAASLALGAPMRIASHPSAFGGTLYAAVMRKRST